MKLTEMRELLAKRDIQLTKSLGQNFLHDAHQLERIAAAGELTKADKVLEIGPGLGPLTELLLAKAGEVLAIEMDHRLVEFLAERFGLESKAGAPEIIETNALGEKASNNPTPSSSPKRGNGTPPLLGERAGVREVNPPNQLNHPDNFFLIHDDALAYIKREPRDWSEWKLVANLPYSVASPIMVELAAGSRAPKMMVVTLQLEVAQRLMAPTDDDHYGILTLLVQLDFEPRGWFKIPPGCFFPAPEVDSACVTLVRRATPLLPEEMRTTYRKIVKKAFSQRRKMMLKLLKQDWPKEKLEAAFAELKISPMERAEKLSLEQFVALTKRLAEAPTVDVATGGA
ncbi:MAG TPA: rRNA adenine dimethyltransferase family protein [Candidatus Acidoferrales bacterium]|jgi:16S rRNA (adenine1518-N6/adenine1519-N6)-dimethyltransferase|nr:rRNA adenine dimethyltransferase family protein [Candidatus Acidoferrales bacterium]